jgi:hypothetical protein
VEVGLRADESAEQDRRHHCRVDQDGAQVVLFGQPARVIAAERAADQRRRTIAPASSARRLAIAASGTGGSAGRRNDRRDRGARRSPSSRAFHDAGDEQKPCR